MPGVNQVVGRRLSAFHCKQGSRNVLVGAHLAEVGAQRFLESFNLALRGDEAAWTNCEADALVAQRDEVADRKFHCCVVVAGDEGRLDARGEPVHKREGSALHPKLLVSGVASTGVCVQARDEQYSVHRVLLEHLDVLVLRGAAGGLSAQKRCVSAL